jgi:hypothetical protein
MIQGRHGAAVRGGARWRTLALYGSSNLDWGETMLLAGIDQQQQWAEFHSSDADFDRLPGSRGSNPDGT